MPQRGFPSISLVNASIRLLYSSLKAARIRSFSNDLLVADLNGVGWAEPTIAVQRMARAIAMHYRLAISTVVVTFRSDLSVPGRVELSNSSDFFIEIHSDHRFQPDCVAAILTHEIAHIFLHMHRIRFEPEFQNEVLTDTAAAYLGGGIVILNGTTETEREVDLNRIEKHSRHFGYLTVDEFGYVLAKRDILHSRDSCRCLKRGLPKDGYRTGRRLLEAERRERPFVPRPVMDRLAHQIVRKLGRDEAQSAPMVFPCPSCSQPLRLPRSRKKLSVHCSICDSYFDCYS